MYVYPRTDMHIVYIRLVLSMSFGLVPEACLASLFYR